ncbi:MAG: hypothetical protein AAGF12_29620 [Myxococcota bacterium]
MTDHEREQRASLRFGWTWLALSAAFGVGLETAHGFKWAPYLDDELARLLLTLGHAHGVGLSLVVLVYAFAGASLHRGRLPGHLLRAGALLIPLGFALSAIGHPEGDPSPLIVLTPLGAVLLLVALFWTAVRTFSPAPPMGD